MRMDTDDVSILFFGVIHGGSCGCGALGLEGGSADDWAVGGVDAGGSGGGVQRDFGGVGGYVSVVGWAVSVRDGVWSRSPESFLPGGAKARAGDYSAGAVPWAHGDFFGSRGE